LPTWGFRLPASDADKLLDLREWVTRRGKQQVMMPRAGRNGQYLHELGRYRVPKTKFDRRHGVCDLLSSLQAQAHRSGVRCVVESYDDLPHPSVRGLATPALSANHVRHRLPGDPSHAPTSWIVARR
jgi:hypothetical protein